MFLGNPRSLLRLPDYAGPEAVPYTWAALLSWLSAKRDCRMGSGCLDSLVRLAGWAGLEAGLSL